MTDISSTVIRGARTGDASSDLNLRDMRDASGVPSTHARGCGCSACQNNEEERDVSENVNAADNTSTSNSMDVGDTFSGSLQAVGNTDWVALNLTAGQSVNIAMNSSEIDTFLYLYNSSGNLITFDDDGGPGLNSLLEFTATTTGTYYVVANSFGNNDIGS